MKENEKKTGRKTGIRESALVGLMAALLCIAGPLTIPVPFSLVPVSITNLALYIVLYVLGTRKGCISYFVYLLIGLVGLPVFSAFTGGIGKVLGPTGGYLLGFVFMLLISGWFIDRWYDRPIRCMAGMVLGMAVCYLFGTLWLSLQSGMTFEGALMAGVIPFLFGDVVKILIAAFGGPKIRKRLRKAGLEE